MEHDLGGRLIETMDANGHATRFEYDAQGQRTKQVTALGFEIRTQYDANGNLTHVTDPNAATGLQPKNNQNASVYREYDELNRVKLERDATNHDTSYTYDLLGNITSITDALSQVTTFRHDDLGRLIETIDPVVEGTDKTDRVLLYDEAGNALLTEDRTGRQRRHTFDVLNRRGLTRYLADGTEESFVFDAFGDLIQTANNDVTYTYTYTPRHELQSKTDSRLGKTLSWTYDATGKITAKTDYQGEVTTYQYDSAGRLTAEANQGYVQVSYHYDAAGRLIDRILSNGAKTTYRHDNDNRLIGLKNLSANGTVVEDIT
jgi:YD repeat-containing protein